MPRTELIRVTPTEPPSRFARMADALRSYWRGPLTAKSPEIARIFGDYGPVLSGVSVNEQTALTSSAVWSAVSLISDDIASLPLHLYKRTPDGGKQRYDAHPLYRLLHDEPNPEMDAIVFRRTMQAHVLLWQNAYAEIERDGAGRAIALWPLVPERVSVERRGTQLRYRVRNEQSEDVLLSPADMIHLVGHSHDGSAGSSMVQLARESIGLALAAEQFGATFFGNGATFGGVISMKGAKPPEMSDQNYRATLEARHQGVQRAHKILALYNEATFTPTGVEPNSAQFLETRVFQIREVARWFKMPPHKLGDLADATYSNVEQMDAAYLSSCLRPWLILWEQQLTRKLVAKLERTQQFIEHDTHGFLSVDAASRAAIYTAESSIGSITINEIRGYENRNPIAGGEQSLVQIQNIPLNLIGEYWRVKLDREQAEIEKLKAPPPPPPVDAEAQDRTIRELRSHLDQAKGQIEEARAEALHLGELLGGARQALGQEQTERQTEKVALELRIAELGGRVEERDGTIAALTDNLDAVLESLKAEEAQSTRLLDHFNQEFAAHEATKERAAQAEQARDEAFQRVAVAEEAAREAEEARQSAAAELADTVTQRDAAQAESQRHLATLLEMRDAYTTAIAAVQADKAAAEQRADAQTASADEALAAQATATSERDAAIAERDTAIAHRDAAQNNEALAEAARVAAEQRAHAAERDKAIAEQAQRAANELIATLQVEAEQMRDAHAARVSGLLVAHRGLVVDIMQRMVEREIDRAKRHQTTPQKFRAWLDTFYETHVETIAEALLPAVRAHLAILSSQSDPHELARTLAEDHVAESEKQLRDLLHIEDFAPNLERTLTRWATARPEQVADRLLTKGLADVR